MQWCTSTQDILAGVLLTHTVYLFCFLAPFVHAVCYGAYVISPLEWTAWSKAEGLVSVCVHRVSKHIKALRHKDKIRPRWSMKNSEEPFCIYLEWSNGMENSLKPNGMERVEPSKTLSRAQLENELKVLHDQTWHLRIDTKKGKVPCTIPNMHHIEWYWSRIWFFVMLCRYWLCIVWCIRWCSLCSHKFRGCLRGRDAQDLTDTCRHMAGWSWS